MSECRFTIIADQWLCTTHASCVDPHNASRCEWDRIRELTAQAEKDAAEVERLTTMRAQVLQMHYRDVHPHEDRCQRDGDSWPCRDVQALRGESDE